MTIRYTMKDLKEMIEQYFGFDYEHSEIYVKDWKEKTENAKTVENIFIDDDGSIIIEVDKTIL